MQKRFCDKCNKERLTSRFRYVWYDLKRRYRNSNHKIQHTRHFDFCAPCLKQIEKLFDFK